MQRCGGFVEIKVEWNGPTPTTSQGYYKTKPPQNGAPKTKFQRDATWEDGISIREFGTFLLSEAIFRNCPFSNFKTRISAAFEIPRQQKMNCNTVTLENDPAGIFNFLTELYHSTFLIVFSSKGQHPPSQGDSILLSPLWRCVTYLIPS